MRTYTSRTLCDGLKYLPAIFSGVVMGTSLWAQAPTPPRGDRGELLSEFSRSLDSLAARISPAVVQIDVTGYGMLNTNDTGQVSLGKEHGLGSGVIVDADGYILTNAHVVKGAERIRVQLTSPTGASQVNAMLGETDRLPPQDATLVGIDQTVDVALLKINAKNLPTVPFADYTKLAKGQIVLAFGNPEGLENSVTMGIVSAVARRVLPDVPTVYIQSDASINPGNSGGPLVNTDGELVGINTFILSQSGGSQGLSFAIPSDVVRFEYEQLRKYGHVHRSIIGAELQDITPDLAGGLHLDRQRGVIVADVEPDGPADKAGMKIQDILLTLDGRTIGTASLAQMIISTRSADSLIEAEVLRGTQQIKLEMPVTERKDQVDELADLNPSKALVARLGIFGVEINDQLAAHLPNLRRPSGVIVAALAATIRGAATNLEPGDVIHALNGNLIETLDDLRSALSDIQPGGPGVLQVERNGKLMYAAFEMD